MVWSGMFLRKKHFFLHVHDELDKNKWVYICMNSTWICKKMNPVHASASPLVWDFHLVMRNCQPRLCKTNLDFRVAQPEQLCGTQ